MKVQRHRDSWPPEIRTVHDRIEQIQGRANRRLHRLHKFVCTWWIWKRAVMQMDGQGHYVGANWKGRWFLRSYYIARFLAYTLLGHFEGKQIVFYMGCMKKLDPEARTGAWVEGI